MINGKFGFREQIGKSHLKQKDQGTSINACAIGCIHRNRLAMCFDFDGISQFTDLVINDRFNDRRREIILNLFPELSHLCASRSEQHASIRKMQLDFISCLRNFDRHKYLCLNDPALQAVYPADSRILPMEFPSSLMR